MDDFPDIKNAQIDSMRRNKTEKKLFENYAPTADKPYAPRLMTNVHASVSVDHSRAACVIWERLLPAALLHVHRIQPSSSRRNAKEKKTKTNAKKKRKQKTKTKNRWHNNIAFAPRSAQISTTSDFDVSIERNSIIKLNE